MTYTEMSEKYPLRVSIYDSLLQSTKEIVSPTTKSGKSEDDWCVDDLFLVPDVSGHNSILIFKSGDSYYPTSLMDFTREALRAVPPNAWQSLQRQ